MEPIYLGITPYDEDGNFEFAGRNDETWALYDRIIRNEYTVYYAASGEGKSSLIRAGLLPILRRRDFFPVYIVFEDKEFEDLSSIENVIANRIKVETEKHNVTYVQSSWSKSRFDQEVSGQLETSMWWRLRNYCFKRGDTELKPLFIFDQFEEVFTKADYAWTNSFFSWLEIISTDYLPDSLREFANSKGIEIPAQKNFKALFSFRTEYLGDLDYWCVQKHFIPSLQENRMCLKPLTPKGAKEIINLNEESLGRYADRIIQGCSEAKVDTNNEEQPCVYALILSVVCQTLSESTDKERVSLLENLNNQQDDTIDDILLRFYKRKLQEVGLDYNRNEKIIADIEDALVDEKGKRSRRDTDEASMQPLSKWIDLLCDKKNGLLKIIGRKEIGGKTVCTVEFPHDRLCKAIDSSRKERQGKVSWKLKRNEEWMQFGVIAIIMGLFAFLWNALLPLTKPVMLTFLYNGSEQVINLFVKHYLNLGWLPSEYAGYSLDEGFSTLLLMFAYVLYFPLLTFCIGRKNKKWQISSALISLCSLLSFLFLWYKNKNISFDSNYVPIFTFIGILGSGVFLCMAIVKLRRIYLRKETGHSDRLQYSNWPFWGGYLIFAAYLFYEFLFRTTFGISEPCDSFWALIVIPLLYSAWAWGFFNMRWDENAKVRMTLAFIFSVILLACLSIISLVPFYNDFKQRYGFSLSVILILLWIVDDIYIVGHAKSNSKYYLLSKPKKSLAIISGVLCVITAFIYNLGYNPIAINPKTVCNVCTWRTVMVNEEDSIAGKRLGVLYPTNGDTIIPCCNARISRDKVRFYIESKFSRSPFRDASIKSNADSSMEWRPYSHVLSVLIPVLPTLEEYLHGMTNRGLSNNSSLKDSIDYYAARLFCEMRDANVTFALEEKPYGLEELHSLDILDSLQHIAFFKELGKFSLEAMDTVLTGRGPNIRPRVEVIEDKHLIDFHCELARSFLLCHIKDRAIQSDMPSMFTLANTYLMAFFTSVQCMHQNIHSVINFGYRLNTTDQGTTISDIVNEQVKISIYSDDILNKRFFAWYDLFDCLCYMDMGYNADTFSKTYSIGETGDWAVFEDIKEELYEILVDPTSSVNGILKNCRNSADSLSVLTELFKKMRKARDPQYYESISERLEKITPVIKTIEVDESLGQMKDTVLNTLTRVMENRLSGIYNNDFENICEKLILVSAFRGNDIQEDTTKLSGYLTKKDALYDLTKRAITSSNRQMQYKKEIEEKLKETIELLKNK